VNNAGAEWRSTFGDGGYENVRRTMDVNFDAVVRLTEALLPLLRASAPSAVVNVSSVAGRVGRPRNSAYAASKFALAGWSEAVGLEEEPHGVHVGVVLPGFISTDGFPHTGLRRSARTRWLVGSPEQVAKAIRRAGPGGRREVYVPRFYGFVPRARHLTPGLTRRALGGGRVKS
jgi:short-subunit dehydrogenase